MLLKYAGLWAEDVSCVEGHLAMLNSMPTSLASNVAESCYKPCKRCSVLEDLRPLSVSQGRIYIMFSSEVLSLFAFNDTRIFESHSSIHERIQAGRHA